MRGAPFRLRPEGGEYNRASGPRKMKVRAILGSAVPDSSSYWPGEQGLAGGSDGQRVAVGSGLAARVQGQRVAAPVWPGPLRRGTHGASVQ